MRQWIALALLAPALAACGAGGEVGSRPAGYVPVPHVPPGAAGVMGQNSRALIALFGQPDADMQEGSARKLQFASQICVLDAYLYPARGGRGEPVVTYVDTRQRNGGPIDQASCIAALTRRQGGR